MTDERPLADAETVTIGILFMGGDDEAGRARTAPLEAIDPRIRVVPGGYEEAPELRTARGTPPYDGLREKAPVLSDEQKAMFAEVDIVVTLDLPFDVGTVAPNLALVQGLNHELANAVNSLTRYQELVSPEDGRVAEELLQNLLRSLAAVSKPGLGST